MLSDEWTECRRHWYPQGLLCLSIFFSASGAGVVTSPLSGYTHFVGDTVRCQVSDGVQADTVSVKWSWLSGAQIGVGRDVSVVVAQNHVGTDSIVAAVTMGAGSPLMDTVGIRVLPYDAIDVWCGGGGSGGTDVGSYWHNRDMYILEGTLEPAICLDCTPGVASWIVGPRGGSIQTHYWTNGQQAPFVLGGKGALRGIWQAPTGQVLLCGCHQTPDSEPCAASYWDYDGTMLRLDSTGNMSEATAIAVDQDSISVAGYTWVERNGWQIGVPWVWRSGAVQMLPPPRIDTAWDVRSEYAYWSGSTPTWLASQSGRLFVGGEDRIEFQDAGFQASWLWHDGEKTFLMADTAATNPVDHLPAALSYASFAVGRNGVYATAWQLETWQSYFWHDGIPRLASEVFGSDLEELNLGPVAELHGHVFVAGRYRKDGKWQLCYWRNGVRTDLPGGDQGYVIRAMCVAEKSDSTGAQRRRWAGPANRSQGLALALSALQIEGRNHLEARYILRRRADVTAVILDPSGRRVLAAKIGLRSQGPNKDVVDLAQLAPGRYVLNLSSGGESATGWFVLR